MEPYREMYLALFGSVTQAIEDLQQAQRQCEELFAASGEGEASPKPEGQVLEY